MPVHTYVYVYVSIHEHNLADKQTQLAKNLPNVVRNIPHFTKVTYMLINWKVGYHYIKNMATWPDFIQVLTQLLSKEQTIITERRYSHLRLLTFWSIYTL